MDDLVVTAAARALDTCDVIVVLPYVPASAEAEVTEAFELASGMEPRSPRLGVGGPLLLRTVVRPHRVSPDPMRVPV